MDGIFQLDPKGIHLGQERLFIGILHCSWYACGPRDLRPSLDSHLNVAGIARRSIACQHSQTDMLKDVLAVFKHYLGLYLLIRLPAGGRLI